MKKNPEKPEKVQAPSGVDSWSNEMHHRFVPDPGVVPLGKTLSLARRIQRKARPHDLTRSIMDRYGKRRQDGNGSSGDMPFYVPYQAENAPVPVVQGVFRENAQALNQRPAPVVSGQRSASMSGEIRNDGMHSSVHAAHEAENTSGETRPGAEAKQPSMVPASVAFARGLTQGKRSLVQRALDRSGGTMGLLKDQMKTGINPQTPSPVVQAKIMSGGPELTLPPGREPSEGHAGYKAGEARQSKSPYRGSMPGMEPQTGPMDAAAPLQGPTSQVLVDSGGVTVQRKASSQETVQAREVVRDSTHPVHQDLPISRPDPVSQEGHLSRRLVKETTVPGIKQDGSTPTPPVQGKAKGEKTVPVVQAKEQAPSHPRAEPLVRSPHISVGTGVSPGSSREEPAKPITRADSPVAGAESGGLPVQRQLREPLSGPEKTESVNTVAVQAVRQTGAQASTGPETPLVHSRPAGDRPESRSSSGGNETPSDSVQVQKHTGPSSPKGAARHPESLPARNGQMPVVSPVQAVTENRTPGWAPAMTSAPEVQAKIWPDGQHAPLAQAPSTDNSVSVAQRVRVPEIRQSQAVDFQPMPMTTVKSGDASPSSASHLPVQRQSEADTRAQQGPSLPDASASQPSPVSMEPMEPPTMEGNTLANLHEIAERVYEMLMDRLSIERESLGL